MGKYGCNPPIFGKHTMEDSVAAKRLFLLSGHKAFREAMACVLEQESDLEVVSQAGSLADMADANLDHNIDVALVDLSLSDGDAMAALRELSTQHGDVAVLGLSSSGPSSSVVRALGAGAAGVPAAASGRVEGLGSKKRRGPG